MRELTEVEIAGVSGGTSEQDYIAYMIQMHKAASDASIYYEPSAEASLWSMGLQLGGASNSADSSTYWTFVPDATVLGGTRIIETTATSSGGTTTYSNSGDLSHFGSGYSSSAYDYAGTQTAMVTTLSSNVASDFNNGAFTHYTGPLTSISSNTPSFAAVVASIGQHGYITAGGGADGLVAGVYLSGPTGFGIYGGIGTPGLSATVGFASDATSLLNGPSGSFQGYKFVGGAYSGSNDALTIGYTGAAVTYGVPGSSIQNLGSQVLYNAAWMWSGAISQATNYQDKYK